LLYTAGAVVYVRELPDPVPAAFGYHEVSYVLVIAAAALQYAAIAFCEVAVGVAGGALREALRRSGKWPCTTILLPSAGAGAGALRPD
jgi:hypothetical protein